MNVVCGEICLIFNRIKYCNKKKETQYFLIVIAHHYNKWVVVKKNRYVSANDDVLWPVDSVIIAGRTFGVYPGLADSG